MLVIGIAGCNGKPATAPETAPTPPAVSPQPTAQARDDRPVIVAFGDSLTAGYGTDAGNSYPDFLEQDLNAKGFHYRVVNAGISGNTTKDGIERLDDVLALKHTQESRSDCLHPAARGNKGRTRRHHAAAELRRGLHPPVQ
jgi:acyl-CoA thioesterase-1